MPLQHYPEIESLISWALPNLGGKRVLDVGCGTGGIGFLLRRLPGGNDAYIVGVDGWEPYLEFVRRFNIYDEVHLADLANWTPEPFDIILAVEVLEHLEKEQGLRLLDRLEHAAREVLLVTTPNGDDRRGPVADVPLEAHRSTWHAREFIRRGYRVRGLGFRWSRKERAHGRLALALWYIMTPLSVRFPTLGDSILATRKGPR
ncbi:MAG: class I SAM-dependent methyltransferase [Armatimonadota bacterium]|nr:class I SAM-dependent methyltransferase [Armatimonadota bacterium]